MKPARAVTSRYMALLAACVAASVIGETAPGGVASANGVAPPCKAAQLRLAAEGSSAGAGSVLTQFGFMNARSGRCTLRGYPRVQMLDRAGKRLQTFDSDAPPGAAGATVKTITLSKGRRAWFGIHYATQTGFGRLECPTAARLLVTLPHVSGTLTISGGVARIAPYGGSTVHLRCGELQVTPFSVKSLI